jgi:hypothetical protein
VTLQKYFLNARFVCSPSLSFMGLQTGGRLLIAIHLDQSNYVANQQQVLCSVVPFTSLSILWINAWPKPFYWAKLACLDFSSSNFLLLGHILSTGGANLSSWIRGAWVTPDLFIAMKKGFMTSYRNVGCCWQAVLTFRCSQIGMA